MVNRRSAYSRMAIDRACFGAYPFARHEGWLATHLGAVADELYHDRTFIYHGRASSLVGLGLLDQYARLADEVHLHLELLQEALEEDQYRAHLR